MAPKPKLTIAQIGEIKSRLAADDTLTITQIAQEYGVDKSTISRAVAPYLPPAAPSTLAMLPLDLLFASPLNPRKNFDDAAIAELAESIAADGLLQNLVVLPASENNLHEIIAGERRFRALEHLAKSGRWNAPVPCLIKAVDAATHMALALLENLQRQDVPPLDEAEAFARLQALAPTVWTASAIAARINKSARYVQQRLAFANKLCPGAKTALAAGNLSIGAARLLTTASQTVQQDILDRAEGKISEDDLWYEIMHTLFAVKDAIFDVAAAGLETFEQDGEEFFEDRKAAGDLQMQAVQAKAKAIKKAWAFVEVMKPGESLPYGQWQRGFTKAAGGGCVITIHKADFRVIVHEGMKRVESKPARPPAAEHPNAALFRDDADEPQPPPELVIPAQAAISETAPATAPDPEPNQITPISLEHLLSIENDVYLDDITLELIDAFQAFIKKWPFQWPSPLPVDKTCVAALCDAKNIVTPDWALTL